MINFPDYTVVDLTLPLGPDTLMWPGELAPTAQVIETVKHDGNYGRRVQFYEHSGTHVDAPNHFVDGGKAVTDLPLQTLISPAIVIDASADINGNGDAVLELATVKVTDLFPIEPYTMECGPAPVPGVAVPPPKSQV